MQKLLKLAVLILSVPIIYIIYKETNINYINLTVLGDGLSQGINCYNTKDYGYGEYLKDYYNEKKLIKNYFKEFTKNDMSIEMLRSYILINKKTNYDNKKDNIRHILGESSLIVMSIGLNDLYYKITISNKTISTINNIVKETYKDLENLLEEINKYYNNTIYIIGYYESSYFDYKMNYAISEYNKLLQKNNNIIYIHTNNIIKNDQKYLENPDSYYPNTEGYQAISSKIISKIGKKLEKV